MKRSGWFTFCRTDAELFFLVCFSNCHLLCHLGGSLGSMLGFEAKMYRSRGGKHFVTGRLNGDGLQKQANEPTSSPALPNKLFLAWKVANYFIANRPVHMYEVLTGEMYCNTFSLWSVFLVSKLKDVMVFLSSSSMDSQKRFMNFSACSWYILPMSIHISALSM